MARDVDAIALLPKSHKELPTEELFIGTRSVLMQMVSGIIKLDAGLSVLMSEEKEFAQPFVSVVVNVTV